MDRRKNVTIKKALYEIILSSTSHGFPNIIRSKNISMKLIWTVFTLISITACVYMTAKGIIQFFDYEVTTKIRMINEYQSIFPTVTFCNINHFTYGSSVSFLNHIKNISDIFHPLRNDLSNHLNSLLKKSEFQNAYQSDSLEKILVDCTFNFYECNRSEFKLFVHPNFGNCFQFNSGYDSHNNKIGIKYSISKDKYQGLRLVLNVSVVDSLKFVSPSYGAVIYIHNQSSNPWMVEEITLMPKYETNIAIKRTLYNSKEKPYSNCDGNTNNPRSYSSDLFKLIHNKTNQYNQYSCVIQCLQRKIIKECGCYSQLYFSLFDSNPCMSDSEIGCNFNFYERLLKGEYFYEFCLKECPLECEVMWFDKTISQNQFSNYEYDEKIRNHSLFKSKSVRTEDLVVVNVYFSSLSYTKISEIPTTKIVDLISAIGGIAGLFLGVSMLTFVEVIEAFVEIIIILTNSKKINDQKN